MTHSEENYLKIIYHLSLKSEAEVSTNAIAGVMDSKPSSVTDMVQKLAEKELVSYKKYQGVSLTEKGKKVAVNIIRKHRLWEVFLVEKLNFSWDEVHDIAEQLEHIKSEQLTNRLDEFLDFPTEDPHGDPIPNKNGEIPKLTRQLLADAPLKENLICVGVKDSSSSFLQYLDKQNISLGTLLQIIDKEDFDKSLKLLINQNEITVSHMVANNIFVKQR
ncbi:MAG: metal-dependent transcriptional regulator [Flavobacteriaceae bacterium]